MYKLLFILFFVLISNSYAQSTLKESVDTSELAFKDGEWLRYKLSYSNFLKAGEATISVKEIVDNNKEAFHIIGKGKSVGLVGLFFKVRDNYESYIYKNSLKPYRFKREINEGGYTKNKEILFDYETNQATVKNYKHNTEKKYPITNDIQDMLSAMYYLRNQNIDSLNVNDQIELKLFFDQETYNFKLLFLGKEQIKTQFGKVNTLKFRPVVQAGRVFKEQESVTIWVSSDKNKIPLRIKASLAVGSLRADLDGFKSLAHPFSIVFDN